MPKGESNKEQRTKEELKLFEGFTPSNPLYNWDIYSIVEAPQELYFGHEVQVNVNIVEVIKLPVPNDGGGIDIIEKCYMSPTKRRGVERRCLLWAPYNSSFLGEQFSCSIPSTCGNVNCPICRVFGALITEGNRVTFIGRLTHGGGVAVQPLPPEEKQRLSVSSDLRRTASREEPTPFKREYNEPGLLYPIYNHYLSMDEEDFSAAAYAFLESLRRLGAGNPKGIDFYKKVWLSSNKKEPLLVLDKYLVAYGKRPIISPSICDVNEALEDFETQSLQVKGQSNWQSNGYIQVPGNNNKILFERWIGDKAWEELIKYQEKFINEVVEKRIQSKV